MRTMPLASATTVALLLGVASCGGAATTSGRSAPTPSTSSSASGTSMSGGPCGTTASPPTYTHVVWVWMENHSYGDIIGSSQAPYLNSLAARCGLATNYHNLSHPSLPNYVGATSGLGLSDLQQFKSDCSPSKQCGTAAESVFGQSETSKAYEESMPSNCYRHDAGEYAVRHNPPLYFTTLNGCASLDVPYSELSTNLASDALPAFSFVTPNVMNDMHDGTVARGDTWLSKNLPAILNSAEYMNRSTAVFLTWDEGAGSGSDDCATNTADVGCHVATLVISPSTVPGTASGTLFNHYSLLGTAEELLGKPKLGLAASVATMTSAFNL